MKNHPGKVHAIILAGGRAERFEGRDKGLLTWKGKPLVEHVIERLVGQVDSFTISCNRNINTYASLAERLHDDLMFKRSSLPVYLTDNLLPNFQGPLAGIYEFLQLVVARQSKISAVNQQPVPANGYFICCCDCPLLPKNIVAQLYAEMHQTGAKAAFARDRSGPHFLTALIDHSIADYATKVIGEVASVAGNMSAKAWLRQIDAMTVNLTQIDKSQGNLSNINSPTDLEKLG